LVFFIKRKHELIIILVSFKQETPKNIEESA
jgi:hypothetical protein